MNVMQVQNQLKGMSQEQLIAAMQRPMENIPQFLVLGEITRRRKMETEMAGQDGDDQTTVAQEAVAAAGVPQQAAGQYAQTMAPQTDMAMNTAAAPAQTPQRMAGGGIVALQEGGRVPSSRTFVRNGMIMMIDDQGREVAVDRAPVDPAYLDLPPQEDLDRRYAGRIQSERTGSVPRGLTAPAPTGIGALPGIADGPAMPRTSLPLPYPQSNALDGATGYLELPPQSDLDQRFMEEQFGIGRMLAGMESPAEGSAPAGSALTSPGAPRSAPGLTAPDTTRAEAYLPDESSTRMAVNRMMMDSSAPESRAAMAAYAPSLFSAVPTGEGQAFNFDTSPLRPVIPSAGPNAPTAGTDLRGLGTTITDIIGGEDPRATADRLLSTGQIDRDQYNRYIFGSSGERNRVIRESLGYEEPLSPALPNAPVAPSVENTPVVAGPTAEAIASAEEAAALRDELGITESLRTPEDQREAAEAARDAASLSATAPAAAPSGGSGGGSGGGGGGLAALTSSATQGPGAYEGELRAMLDARAKRAEQDKWMALAQAGMALMSSRAPSFGSAVGEAASTGLAAFQQGQSSAEADRFGLLKELTAAEMNREQLAMQRQAAAARAAGSGRGSDPSVSAAMLNALVSSRDSLAERLADAQLRNADPVVIQRLADQVAAMDIRVEALMNAATIPYGAPSGGASVETPTLDDVRQ